MRHMSYDVLKNRLTNGEPYDLDTARARINALADNLEITQEQAAELLALAEANAATPSLEERLAELEVALAALLAAGGADT